MEDGTWTCVFSSDPSAKKRKRWSDGTLVLCNKNLQLRDETNANTLSRGKVEALRGAAFEGGEEIKVGRYTVQLGEESGRAADGTAPENDETTPTPARHEQLQPRWRLKQQQQRRQPAAATAIGQKEKDTPDAATSVIAKTTDVKNSDPRAPTVAIEVRALYRPKAPPTEARRTRGKFKAPARLSQGNVPPPAQKTCVRGTAEVESPNNDNNSSRNDSNHSTHALGAPRASTMNETVNGSSNRSTGGVSRSLGQPRVVAAPPPGYYHPRPLPSAALRTGQHSLQQGQQQQEPQKGPPRHSSSSAPVLPTGDRKPRTPLPPSPLHARRRAFFPPSKTGPRPPAPPPLSSLASQSFPPTRTQSIRARQTGASSSGGMMSSAPPRTGANDDPMPPFKLRFGGARNGARQALIRQQQQHHQHHQHQHQQEEQQPDVDEGRVPTGGRVTPSAIERPQGKEQGDPACSSEGGGRPTRRAWVPNGFVDAVSYRSMFAAAMQEEVQLILDETIVARFEKAGARLEASGPRGCADRRNPLWRQKHFRSEGVPYYSSVSLFRAGGGSSGGGGGGKSAGKSKRWGKSSGKGQGWKRGGDGSDGDDADEDDGGKLYIKILGVSDSKEANSAYGKGDIWALSETGRFIDGDDVVFCRSYWHGVSSQGMLYIGPLGDDSEAPRLEGMAGRGGGSSSARSVHAIRCFNAQTDLSALDLLRAGYIQDHANEATPPLTVPLNARGLLGSVPVLPYLLSGGLDGCRTSEVPGARSSKAAETTPRPTYRKIVPLASGERGDHDGNAYGRGRGEAVFDLCLTRVERDAVVSSTVGAFSLNQDQARLLWRCARWFRPAETEADAAKGDEGDGSAIKQGRGLGGGGAKGREEGDAAPVVLVHGVFGAGKSLSLVALCVMVDSIATKDARARPSRGLSPRPKAEQVRVLLAAGTNVAVDRVLTGLVKAGFDDIARIGSHRRAHKSLLEWVVHSCPGRDAKQAAQSDLQDMLRTAVGEERGMVARALCAAKGDSFASDQARRLHEARVTGVTCASATLPLLTQPPPREAGTRGGLGGRKGGSLAKATMGGLGRLGSGGAMARGRIGGGGSGSAGGSGSGAAGPGYDIVVIDECSQIVEPLSLLPIAVAQPRRLVLVGDPMQLPPPVAYARAVVATAPKPPPSGGGGLEEEDAAGSSGGDGNPWLEKANARRGAEDTLEKTLFVRLATLGVTPLLLRRQYRCHPRLSGLASRLFYQGRLTDGVASADRQALVPGLAPLTLVNAAGRGAESTAVGGSVHNLFEAQTVAALVASLLSTRDNGGDIGGGGGGVRVSGGGGGLPAASIGVICLYKAQLLEVRRQLEAASCPPLPASSRPGAGPALTAEGAEGNRHTAPSCCPRDVQVCTVDAFQGAEKDVVIVASTRTERLGFIVSPKRLCVALTRARHHLLVVGEKRVLLTNPLWKEVVNTSNVVTGAGQIFGGGGVGSGSGDGGSAGGGGGGGGGSDGSGRRRPSPSNQEPPP